MTAPPPIPPPPSESFSSKERVGQLVAIKVLRVDPNYPDNFMRNNGNPVLAAFFDVWILDGAPDVGKFISDTPNTSLLGRQLSSGIGQTFYGRLVAEKRGAGTSVVLGNAWPQDGPIIARHQQWEASEDAQARQRPPGYDASQHGGYPPQGQAQPQQPGYGQQYPPQQPQQPQQPQGYPPQGQPPAPYAPGYPQGNPQGGQPPNVPPTYSQDPPF